MKRLFCVATLLVAGLASANNGNGDKLKDNPRGGEFLLSPETNGRHCIKLVYSCGGTSVACGSNMDEIIADGRKKDDAKCGKAEPTVATDEPQPTN